MIISYNAAASLVVLDLVLALSQAKKANSAVSYCYQLLRFLI